MTMFFTTILSLFIFSHVYNLLLMMGGESTLSYRITEDMGIRNSLFLRMAATGTWCGDFFTAWMVIYFYVENVFFVLHWQCFFIIGMKFGENCPKEILLPSANKVWGR